MTEKPPTPTLREAESEFEKALQRVAHGESVAVARAAAQRWVAAARASALEEAAVLALGAHGAGANTKPQQVIAAAIRALKEPR